MKTQNWENIYNNREQNVRCLSHRWGPQLYTPQEESVATLVAGYGSNLAVSAKDGKCTERELPPKVIVACFAHAASFELYGRMACLFLACAAVVVVVSVIFTSLSFEVTGMSSPPRPGCAASSHRWRSALHSASSHGASKAAEPHTLHHHSLRCHFSTIYESYEATTSSPTTCTIASQPPHDIY